MKDKVHSLILLHILLLFYSLGGICSKLAAQEPFLSVRFLLFYGIVLINLVVYAILWQQILKRMSLVTAFSNKAVTVIWGILWGWLFFDEKVTLVKLLGAVIIIVGVFLVVSGEEEV